MLNRLLRERVESGLAPRERALLRATAIARPAVLVLVVAVLGWIAVTVESPDGPAAKDRYANRR